MTKAVGGGALRGPHLGFAYWMFVVRPMHSSPCLRIAYERPAIAHELRLQRDGRPRPICRHGVSRRTAAHDGAAFCVSHGELKQTTRAPSCVHGREELCPLERGPPGQPRWAWRAHGGQGHVQGRGRGGGREGLRRRTFWASAAVSNLMIAAPLKPPGFSARTHNPRRSGPSWWRAVYVAAWTMDCAPLKPLGVLCADCRVHSTAVCTDLRTQPRRLHSSR